MKVRVSKKIKQLASALLVVMVLGGILCMFVVYYLSLIQQQNVLSARSQAWNMAIAITEAGIEYGLEELNSNGTPLASDGWTASGSVYWITNTMPNGSYCVVTNDMSNPTVPVITSRSYVVLPAFATASSLTFFATVGTSSTGPVLVSRAVRVTCGKSSSSLFTASMVAKNGITLNGNGVLSDSFNSSNPAESTNGKYDSTKYTGDHGDVATDASVDVGVGNANIYGVLHTGPTGSYSVGPNGGVGTHAWQAANSGVEPGYFLQNANFTFPNTTLPNTTGYLTPQPGSIVTSTVNVTSNTVTQGTPPSPPPPGGVSTNVVSYSTVSTLPNPIPPGMTSNATTVTSTSYPSPVPSGGVTTNITAYTTVSTPPSPAPAGLVTNTLMVNNSATLPSPVPAGTTTNTTATSSLTYPTHGTYLGNVTTNIVSTGPPSGRGTWYDYNLITSYNYPTYTYTYPSSFSYSYAGYTYTYPNYTYTYGTFLTNTTYMTNTYDNVLYSGNDYVSSALTGSTIVMGPNVTLVLPNGLSGAENITWNYTDNINAGLTIYAGGTSASISGNQYINPSGFAGSLLIYCAPTVTSFTLNGNGQFTGVLVAPNADLKMNGGGNSNQDFSGSLMVNSVTMNGHFSFHWDEALANLNSPNGARYLIQSWNEIP